MIFFFSPYKVKMLISFAVKKARKSLSWPFQKVETQRILARIERQKTLFILALQNDIIGLNRAIHEEISRTQDGVQTISKALEEINLRQTDRDNREVLDWLSPLNFWIKQIDVFEKRHPETGTWLLQNEVFAEWLSGTGKTLWCPGIPGAGKTVLASVIIDHLEETFAGDNVGIAFAYCSYNDQDQKVTNLIASLLQQLVSSSRVSKGLPFASKPIKFSMSLCLTPHE